MLVMHSHFLMRHAFLLAPLCSDMVVHEKTPVVGLKGQKFFKKPDNHWAGRKRGMTGLNITGNDNPIKKPVM